MGHHGGSCPCNSRSDEIPGQSVAGVAGTIFAEVFQLTGDIVNSAIASLDLLFALNFGGFIQIVFSLMLTGFRDMIAVVLPLDSDGNSLAESMITLLTELFDSTFAWLQALSGTS